MLCFELVEKYDAAVGRFWTQDNYSEKYAWMSPYQYAGNSPVMNIDVNGDTLTDAAWKQASRMVEYALAQIERNNNKLVELEEKVKQGKISPKKYLRSKKKIENTIAEHNQTLYELYVLDVSDQVYDVSISDNLGGSGDLEVKGMVSYDKNSDKFMIHLLGDNPELGEVAHEFKHAYQFETGELGFSGNGMYYGYVRDNFYPEQEANKRSSLFGNATKTNIYTGKKYPAIRNSIEASSFSKHFNKIIRYDKKTYIKGNTPL